MEIKILDSTMVQTPPEGRMPPSMDGRNPNIPHLSGYDGYNGICSASAMGNAV